METEDGQNDLLLDSGEHLKAWFKIPPKASGTPLSQALDPESYVKAYWNDKTRPDGRMFPQARRTEIVSSLLKHSAGSALVKQGDTKILCATTVQIGQPAPDLPDHGDVVVNVTTPDQNSHMDALKSWLQRMLDDLLPQRLSLMKGKACIRLIATVLILQDDGNLKDVALTACMAAWKDTKIPTTDELKEYQGKLWWTESPITSLDRDRTQKDDTETKEYRVSLTMGVLEKEGNVFFIVDPSVDEAKFTSGKLTVVVTLPSRFLQVEYDGAVALGATDLALASKMAGGRADEVATLL